MIYAVSDIHGCYDKYQELLEKINFGPDDTLYVLGDVIDRGPDGFKIMLDMAQRPNAAPGYPVSGSALHAQWNPCRYRKCQQLPLAEPV